MSDDFTEWHRLNRWHHTALREGLCTSCVRVHRAGDPGPRPVRAVATWVCKNGNREQLCENCLRFWRENGAEDPQLQPACVLGIDPETP